MNSLNNRKSDILLKWYVNIELVRTVLVWNKPVNRDTVWLLETDTTESPPNAGDPNLDYAYTMPKSVAASMLLPSDTHLMDVVSSNSSCRLAAVDCRLSVLCRKMPCIQFESSTHTHKPTKWCRVEVTCVFVCRAYCIDT